LEKSENLKKKGIPLLAKTFGYAEHVYLPAFWQFLTLYYVTFSGDSEKSLARTYFIFF